MAFGNIITDTIWINGRPQSIDRDLHIKFGQAGGWPANQTYRSFVEARLVRFTFGSDAARVEVRNEVLREMRRLSMLFIQKIERGSHRWIEVTHIKKIEEKIGQAFRTMQADRFPTPAKIIARVAKRKAARCESSSPTVTNSSIPVFKKKKTNHSYSATPISPSPVGQRSMSCITTDGGIRFPPLPSSPSFSSLSFSLESPLDPHMAEKLVNKWKQEDGEKSDSQPSPNSDTSSIPAPTAGMMSPSLSLSPLPSDDDSGHAVCTLQHSTASHDSAEPPLDPQMVEILETKLRKGGFFEEESSPFDEDVAFDRFMRDFVQ